MKADAIYTTAKVVSAIYKIAATSILLFYLVKRTAEKARKG